MCAHTHTHTDKHTHRCTQPQSLAKTGNTKLSCLDLLFSFFLLLPSLFLFLCLPLTVSSLSLSLPPPQMFYLNKFRVEMWGPSCPVLLYTNLLVNVIYYSCLFFSLPPSLSFGRFLHPSVCLNGASLQLLH